jgi:ribonuclease T1
MAALRIFVLALCALLLPFGAAGARDAAPPASVSSGVSSGVSSEIAAAALPREAREVLVLIRAGGPFPHRQDGSVFGNREKRLPAKPRGYYLEYTVRTPGSRDRGARRIVAGRDGEFYYTDDHYNSFKHIRE